MARVLGFFQQEGQFLISLVDVYAAQATLGEVDGGQEALLDVISALQPEKIVTWGEWPSTDMGGVPVEVYKTDLAPLVDFSSVISELCRPEAFYLFQQQFSGNEIHSKVFQSILRYCGVIPSTLKQEFGLQLWTQSLFVRIDHAAQSALSLFANDGSSLFSLLDHTCTVVGKRFLTESMHRPLRDLERLTRRWDMVEHLVLHTYLGTALVKFLRRVPDLRALYFVMFRAKSGKENKLSLKKCMQLYRFSLALKDQLQDVHPDEEGALSVVFETLREIRDNLANFNLVIEKGLEVEEYYKTGEIYINRKFDSHVGDLRIARDAVVEQIRNYASASAHQLGLKNVRLVESNTSTWLLEGPRQQVDTAFRKLGAKNTFKIVQTNKANISFTSSDLQIKIKEQTRLHDQMIEAQQSVELKIRDLVASYYPVVLQWVELIGELDMLQSFAKASGIHAFQRPNVVEGGSYILPELRHPCLVLLSYCVPNSVRMVRDESILHIITGPNMGGKTTYLRQIAIASFLAQIGCFIPCGQGDNQLPLIDAIIARVGASDHQLQGISTFAAEMIEVNCMLQSATSNSLIIIDELGRGTSTTEGFGLVWGLCEYLLQHVGAYTFLATHFQELIRLKDPLIKNFYMEVEESEGKIDMLYRVQEGIMSFSYGIEIAKLLNFEAGVIQDAQAMRRKLEASEEDGCITEDGRIDYSRLVAV